MPPNDSELKERIVAARARTLAWYRTMHAPEFPIGVSRISAAHNAQEWPGMLLPGTYNAVMGRALLDDLSTEDAPSLREVAEWILSHRQADGRFRVPGMVDGQVFKKPDIAETWQYIDFHVTNYCLGALEFLTPGTPPVLSFAEPWLDPQYLKAWLAERDLRDPWLEGNNIVNLASFFLLLRHYGNETIAKQVDDAVRILLDWHYRLQEPSTAFWGVGQHANPTMALHAMAGSMHNFHLWYALGIPLPYQDKAVDYALTRCPEAVSACIDVDLTDLLVHAGMCIEHRREETEKWLRALLDHLLAFQNEDGGFSDELTGIRRQDGWVSGYWEPQGLSNTFATWFRWIAIAMISDFLWPEWRRPWSWRFRKMIGIGYRMEKQ